VVQRRERALEHRPVAEVDQLGERPAGERLRRLAEPGGKGAGGVEGVMNSQTKKVKDSSFSEEKEAKRLLFI